MPNALLPGSYKFRKVFFPIMALRNIMKKFILYQNICFKLITGDSKDIYNVTKIYISNIITIILFCCIFFKQINAVLVSIRDVFQKYKNVRPQNFE